MAINKADVTGTVKTRLGLTNATLDPLVESYVDEIEQRILNNCNVDVVPDGLKFVWASMTMDALRVELPNQPAIADTVGGEESVKIGDTQTAPVKVGLSNTGKSVIDAVVLNYRVDLSRYRKMRW